MTEEEDQAAYMHAQDVAAAIDVGYERGLPKHDPHCDCGICAYCNGQEDVYGNPTSPLPVEQIVAQIRRLSPELRLEVIHAFCTCCGDADSSCKCWNDE